MEYRIKKVHWKRVQIVSIIWCPLFASGIVVLPPLLEFNISVNITVVLLLLGDLISVILFHVIWTRYAEIKLTEEYLLIDKIKIDLTEIEGFCINRKAWFLKQIEIQFRGKLLHLYTYKFGDSSLEFEKLVLEFQTIMASHKKFPLGEIDLHPFELKFEKYQSKYALLILIIIDLTYFILFLMNILKFKYQIIFINILLIGMAANGSPKKDEE